MVSVPRRVLQLTAGIVLVGLLSFGSAAAQPLPAVVDSMGRSLLGDRPGAVVIGLLHGDTTSVHAVGAIDSTGAAPTGQTVFEIGSITKTFTGLLLAERIERGSLRPSTPVARLLPDSVEIARADSVGDAPLTLGHLATHRSGLPRLPSNVRAVASSRLDPYAAYGDSALYAFLDAYTLRRAPGSQYEYSNLGMGLLGHLIARRADTSYAALVRRRIAEPLGLSDTQIRLTPDQEERFAQGYNRIGLPTPPWHFEALAGAGALRSTAKDMLAYLRAHRRALRADSDTATALERAMRRALMPRAQAGSDRSRIGFAWHETRRDGHRVLWHNGSTGGFRSMVALDRTTGRGVGVFASTAVAARQVTDAAWRLLKRLRPD